MRVCLQQKEKSVTYFSKIFQSTELNYDVKDKELLAVVSILKNWKVYLKGAEHKITVLSDHENLTKFTTIKELNRRQARWSEALVSYNFVIEHVSGLKNGRADALSRRLNYKISLKEKKSLLRWNNKRLKLAELFTSKTVSNDQRF